MKMLKIEQIRHIIHEMINDMLIELEGSESEASVAQQLFQIQYTKNTEMQEVFAQTDSFESMIRDTMILDLMVNY